MIRVRYTQWDGSQAARLDSGSIFESFAAYLSEAHDAEQALNWIIRHGLDAQGLRLVGVEEILEEVRAALRSRFASFDWAGVMRAVRDELDEILAKEAAALEKSGGKPDAMEEKRGFLDRLPRRVSAALARLRDFEFESVAARQSFERLRLAADEIRALEQFTRELGKMFHGSRPLDRTQALELMREVERLKRLEKQLLDDDLGQVDLDLLDEILGVGAVRNLTALQQVPGALEGAGYLLQGGGSLKLSPKAIRKIGELALRDIYNRLLPYGTGSHATAHRGALHAQPERRRRYRYGDQMHLDLTQTLHNAVFRRPSMPLALIPDDFAVFDTDHATSTSTVFLLDMSWSMSWDGRFAAAKKVALAMESLIRTRYPRDEFTIVGFFTRAVRLKLSDLPEASWNMRDPFTNLQDGLRLAANILGRCPAANRQIILVTDGQPTAYFYGGRLYCEWPLSFGGISQRAAEEALKEVRRVTRQGVRINTFMLDDSPPLRAFVDRMTRLNKGRAFYTRPDLLGEYLLIDYVTKKRRRV